MEKGSQFVGGFFYAKKQLKREGGDAYGGLTNYIIFIRLEWPS